MKLKRGIFRKTTLDSGLSILTEKVEGFRSVTIGFFTKHGTRDEPSSLLGISHFLEHMLFKGTKNRTAREIAAAFEDRGGSIDAFTSKEFLSIYARVLDEDLSVALEVIGDIVSNPLFDPEEIEKEKGVVLEEYRGFIDTPEDYVFHLLFQSLFEGHPLSKEILGKPETFTKITRDNLLNRWKEVMNPSSIFIVAAGNVEHEHLVENVNKFQLPLQKTDGFDLEEFTRPSVKKKIENRISQVHFALGVRIPPYKDDARYPLIVLNSLLGIGMSSRLFYELREKRGLVYSVTSFLDFFSDNGIFGIYFSLEPKNLEKAFGVLEKILDDLRKRGITEEELKRTKSRVRGSLALSQESSANRMTRIARMELYLGKYIPVDETLKKFEMITKDEVDEIIKSYINPEKFGYALIGPEEIESWKPMV
jgi:predicted Zn-dependent peptidase